MGLKNLSKPAEGEGDGAVTFQKKLTLTLVALMVLGIGLGVKFATHPGRAWAAVLIAGGLAYFLVMRTVNARYAAVLKAAAEDLGLQYLVSPRDEQGCEPLRQMKLTAESDVFRWKVDGRLPAVAGTYQGFPVCVRVPVGVDFDAGAPDSTRIAVYHKVKMTGFRVYDRSRVEKTPKGRVVPLDDPTFDERFLVIASRPEEARTVLTGEVRRAFLESGGTGFRGVEINRYGVFLHEEGKVSSAELVKERLQLALAVARAAGELQE